MCVLFVSIVVLTLGIFWVINMHRAIESSGGLACSIVTIFHDVQHGYKDSTMTFAGIGGLKFFLTHLRSDLKSMQNVTELENIINRDFPGAKQDLQGKIKSFYDSFKPMKVASCKTRASIPNVTPRMITELTPSINDAVQKEIETIVKVGDTLHETSQSIKQVADGQGQSIIKTLDDVLGYLNTASVQIEQLKKDYLDKLDFKKGSSYLKLFLWISSLSIFGLILFNLMIMYVTMKLKKCMWLNCFSKFIMSSQCCLGGMISGASLTMMIISVFLVNGCYYYDQSLNNKAYLKEIVSNTTYDIAVSCLYNDSTGDLTHLIGAGDAMKNLDKFKELGNFTEQLKPFQNTTSSVTLTKYRDDFLKKVLTYEIIDPLPGNDNFDVNLKNLNDQAKTIEPKDNFQLNQAYCPAGYQVSKPGDAVTVGKGSNYCMIIPQFNHDQIDARYNPRTEANDPYAAMKKCTKTHDQLTQNMIASLDATPGPIASSTAYFKKLSDSIKDAEVVVQKMNKTVNFMLGMKGNIKEILDCRIMRKELIMLKKSICDKDVGFGMKFALQAWLLSVLGPIMSILGCCLCCQTRLAERDKDKRSHSDRKKDLKRGLNGNDGEGVAELQL